MLISSCSSGVAFFLEKSESFPYEQIITDVKIEELGFNKNQFCSNSEGVCISYFFAPPITSKKLGYSIEVDSGNRTNHVELAVQRGSLANTYSGTIVLLHGFRVSKEFMINSALYFRFLGYEVVVPDLLGHGESGGTKKYGVGDSGVVSNLIDDLISKQTISGEKLYLLGSSMGALTAARVSSNRDDIRGLILQAPMPPFDTAVYNYSKANYPLLGNLISEEQFRKGALLALENANIQLKDTRIEPLLVASDTPVLLFSSPADLVSPYDNFKALNDHTIKVIALADRNHASMAVIGETEHQVLQTWLMAQDNAPEQNQHPRP
ncbi:alpha/beta hydrolase [Microbulbifer sp. 2205BS26-8]|uniref:alpha/beta hydrolase n=1 Tax=Microbulbifer sp. 2205BS26-8 TaxID=3064386 RepID=UPI00273E4A75|nr:alpha/beta hydrolase [Microbulbifer sp. 2205BS26-8]MDP5209651.1 alpha/beta fold hydrolase [Microbulbifer sp. 2205BS26-8]